MAVCFFSPAKSNFSQVAGERERETQRPWKKLDQRKQKKKKKKKKRGQDKINKSTQQPASVQRGGQVGYRSCLLHACCLAAAAAAAAA